MSCFYCGKRVSLVRKRSDADFCCDDHREKYTARARRSIETLREGDKQVAAARRLNDCIAQPGNLPIHGKSLDELLMRQLGSPLRFGWLPTGLPVSRARLDIYLPGAELQPLRPDQRNGAAPPPRQEQVIWSIGHVQEGPRPPRPFSISIRLPHGGPRQMNVRQAAQDGGSQRTRTAPSVELGAQERLLARRIATRPKGRSIAALMRTAKPPAPVKPPPPSPPVVATLRHSAMAVNMGGVARPAAIVVRLPRPGMVAMAYAPRGAGAEPAAPSYVSIERSGLCIPKTGMQPGAMPHTHEMRWGNRFVPSPEGFRRRQFYSWETPERFLAMGFTTIAGHRPDLAIAGTPHVAPHVAVAHLWSSPLQDESTVLMEPRRPAPPFPEQVSLPGAIGAHMAAELLMARPGQLRGRVIDFPNHFPALNTWDMFAPAAPAKRQSATSPIHAAHWASGTAEAVAISAWARPQTRTAKRTPAESGISVRKPAFTGPAFAAGQRRAGPSPQKSVAPPVFSPADTKTRYETVITSRKALLPELPQRDHLLRPAAIMERAARAPLGRIAAERFVHPMHEILLPVITPGAEVEMAEGGTLRTPPPAKQSGASFDIHTSVPQLAAAEQLQRFRKRGYEGMHSVHTAPHWPAASPPGLAALAAHAPFSHAARAPQRESAAAMFRTHDLPAAGGFHRACTLTGWHLQGLALPGATDWGRVTHTASVALPMSLVLPVDSLGPIRDWGLAPPPEPEKPPEPVHEDFGAGLANWLCPTDDWRQDIAGVRTGSLALLRPSMNMSDYEFEFLGKIENRSLGFVFRAADTNNYHAVQIALDAAGGVHLARYSVLGGKQAPPAIAPLDLALAKNASCRVKLSVCGSDFKLFANDKPAFDWSDDRLPEGGVGFFSDGEDRARLYWVKVTPFYEAHRDENYPIAALGAEFHREIRIGV
jgi:hypothetical protein